MLFRIEIENFYSIRAKQVIDLVAASNVPDTFNKLAPMWAGAKDRVPKVISIFGPNAAGKSTVLRSISFLSWFVQHSFLLPDGQPLNTWYEPFASAEALNQPTRLAVQFAGPRDPLAAPELQKELCRYSYELELVIPVGGVAKVVSEHLKYWPKGHGRPTTLLSRNGLLVKGSKNFPLGAQGASVSAVTLPHASVIATLAQLRHPQAIQFKAAAGRILCNLFGEKYHMTDEALVTYYANNPKLVESFNKDVQRIDLGLKAMRIIPGTKGPMALFDHEGLVYPILLNHESHGTRNFLQVFPYLSFALENGGIAVLDELDTALHPLILQELVQRFYDPIQNPHNAQLWLTCQNASLLETLSKEEILFSEKDSRGQTTIYGLGDVKAVRREDNYYRKYLGGEFGAVPRFG